MKGNHILSRILSLYRELLDNDTCVSLCQDTSNGSKFLTLVVAIPVEKESKIKKKSQSKKKKEMARLAAWKEKKQQEKSSSASSSTPRPSGTPTPSLMNTRWRKAPLLGSELPSVTATGEEKEKKRKISDAGLSPPYRFPQGSGESGDSSRPPLPGGNVPQYDGEMLCESLVSSSLSSSLDDTGLESSEIIISDGKLQASNVESASLNVDRSSKELVLNNSTADIPDGPSVPPDLTNYRYSPVFGWVKRIGWLPDEN